MKKLLALCLTAMLVLAMVPVIGAAAADTLTLAVSKVEAEIGQEVTVSVSLTSNPGTASAPVFIEYDADALEVVTSESKKLGGYDAEFSPVTANPFIVNWCPAKADVTEIGELATVTFKVKDTAKVGKYTLKIVTTQDDVFDTKFNDVAFTTVDGEIAVVCKHGKTKVEGAVDATCSAVGSTGTTVCEICGEVVKEAEEIAKTAHAETVEGAKDATCTEAGSTGTTKCSVCGEVVKEAEVIEALGHKTEIVGAKEATCEAAGYTGDEVCTVCGETVKTGEEIAQLAHNWVAVEKKDATCAEAGYEAHYACDAGCGKLAKDEAGAEAVTAEEIAIAKLPHTIAKVEGVAATEEKTGVKEHYTCSECEALFADAEGKTEIKAEETIIPVIEKAPENADQGDKAPATNDLVNMFVVIAMLLAAAATSVVVLKKKA